MGLREAHTLKPTTGSIRPSNVIFFDTETTPVMLDNQTSILKLKTGYAAYCRTSKDQYLEKRKDIHFTDNAEFWSWALGLTRSKSKYYLVAHNLIFDLTITEGIERIRQSGWNFLSYYSKGLTSIFRWAVDDKKLIAIDNSNFFQGKLDTWGKLIGLPKLDIDFDTATEQELKTYNQRDVDIMIRLWRIWLQFLDDNDCGNFKLTVPSTAFNTWRYRFMSDKVYIHDNKEVLDMERKAYKGGRTEVLYQGYEDGSTYYYLDVNNMYGAILRDYPYPASIHGAMSAPSVAILERRLSRYCVIADVTIDVSDNFYPMRHENHTCYPIGKYRTTLSTPELELAIERNWLLKVHYLSWYKRSYLFRGFIEYFYNLRLDYENRNNPQFAFICKMIINSLYGKFGQRGFKQKTIKTDRPVKTGRETIYHENPERNYTLTSFGGTLFKEWKEGEAYHSAPAIAAHVTAYARVLLKNLINQAGDRNAYYMDTDSVLVNEQGKRNLEAYIDPDALGALKVELSSDWIRINAPKDYAMQGRLRIKGIRDSAQQLSTDTYSQEQWIKLSGLIRRGNVSEYLVKEIIKHQNRVIHSGVLQPDGWVVPFRFPLD